MNPNRLIAQLTWVAFALLPCALAQTYPFATLAGGGARFSAPQGVAVDRNDCDL